MSPATALREGVTAPPAPVDHSTDARLRLLPSPAARLARTTFITLLATVLGLGFLGVLILNTSLQQGAYQLRDLERMTGQLADRRAVLAQRLAVLEAPSRLAGEARLLGMVPNELPVFLRISDGAVLGRPRPAPTPAAPAVPALGPAELRLLDPVQSSALRLPAVQVPAAGTDEANGPSAEQPATERGDKSPTGREKEREEAEKAGAARDERPGTPRDERPGTARGERVGTERRDGAGTARSERAGTSRDERAGTSRDEQPRTSRGER